MQQLCEVSNGRMKLNFHDGQLEAYLSAARFIGVIAGAQSGKTSFGPHWLYKEIKACGPGDYLVVTPTFQLLEKKALAEFRRLFEKQLQVGRYTGSPSRRFVFSREGEKRTFGAAHDEPTVVHFGYAEDPESLESMTAKAAWLDEAGQKKFKLGSWEAIQRRLSLNRGRALITTTPYDLGWLKQQVYDRYIAGDRNYHVVNFDSTMNPMFSREEFERLEGELPKWKFDLFYRGIFTRPAGMIYDCFDESNHKVKRFDIPATWRRQFHIYTGLDFGGVNTAALFYAQNPDTQKLTLYREYKAGGRTAAEHTAHLLDDPFMSRSAQRNEFSITAAVGGSWSEDQWRKEFKAAGLAVKSPDINDVEVGIDRVYAAHKQNQIEVFDDLSGYLAEKMSYTRVLDEAGNATAEIEDKQTFHYMDAERYIIGYLRRPSVGGVTRLRR